MNTFPLNFGPEGAGDGRFDRTASGECIPDGGAWQSQGYTECCAALEKSRAKDVKIFFYLGSDGGFVIPVHSKMKLAMK